MEFDSADEGTIATSYLTAYNWLNSAAMTIQLGYADCSGNTVTEGADFEIEVFTAPDTETPFIYEFAEFESTAPGCLVTSVTIGAHPSLTFPACSLLSCSNQISVDRSVEQNITVAFTVTANGAVLPLSTSALVVIAVPHPCLENSIN